MPVFAGRALDVSNSDEVVLDCLPSAAGPPINASGQPNFSDLAQQYSGDRTPSSAWPPAHMRAQVQGPPRLRGGGYTVQVAPPAQMRISQPCLAETRPSLHLTRQSHRAGSSPPRQSSSAAPGFKDYVSNFAESSKPIDTQRYLQGLNLTNAQGQMTLGNIDPKKMALVLERERHCCASCSMSTMRRSDQVSQHSDRARCSISEVATLIR